MLLIKLNINIGLLIEAKKRIYSPYTSTQSTLQAKKITGKVMDATGEPIIGEMCIRDRHRKDKEKSD